MKPPQLRVVVAGVALLAFVGGVLIALSVGSEDPAADASDDEADEPAPVDAAINQGSETTSTSGDSTTSIAPVPEPDTASADAPPPEPDPPEPEPAEADPPDPIVEVFSVQPPEFDEAMAMATSLAPDIVMPSDCGLPFEVPASLPNSSRDYRSGTHQGIDFICLERGRDAVAAMDGRVLIAVGDYVNPTAADRGALLSIASEVGATPPWTLAMLYGNYVVLDHGVIDGVGHVISIYAHLESVDAALAPAALVTAGQRLGEIGNRGTNAGSTGSERPQSIHLHWEVHVDDQYLSAGLGAADTRSVYRALFAGPA